MVTIKNSSLPPRYSFSSNDFRKCMSRRRNLAISVGIAQEAISIGLTPLFLTLTCEDISCEPKASLIDINRKWRKIRQQAVRKGLTVIGIKAMECHKSGKFHAHVLAFSDDVEVLAILVKRHFKTSANVNENAIQCVKKEDINKLVSYINKIDIIRIEACQKNNYITRAIQEISKIQFFGIMRGTIRKWSDIFKAKFENLSAYDAETKNYINNRKHRIALVRLGAFP